jgi:ATP-binding cassette subfamily C protein EexD
MVTHKPSLLSFADKVLLLKDGQMVMFGPRDEVFQKLAGSRQTSQNQHVQ